MSRLADLLDRCDRAGVRLRLKEDGRTIRYDAPGGIDPTLKADLKANKAELIRYLAAADPIGRRLAEMERDPETGGLVHPEWHALPAEVRAALDERETTPAVEGRPMKLRPALKFHGGKRSLAPKIVALMAPHIRYVEPFAGGLAVLLAKDPAGVSEVVNDIDGDLTNFWRVLQGEDTFRAFHRVVQATPFSEAEWEAAAVATEDDPVRRAVRFFLRCRQSLAGRMDTFAPLSRTRTRRGMNEQASAWLAAVDGLPAVHDRLRRVAVLNRDALDVIRQQDGPGTLFYLDPPYLGETRASPEVYAHEMPAARHAELLGLVRSCKGKVMLSGYPSELYDRQLQDWGRHEFDVPNQAAGGRRKRRMTEVVWCNF